MEAQNSLDLNADKRNLALLILKVLCVFIGGAGFYGQLEGQQFSFFASLFYLILLMPICWKYIALYKQKEGARDYIAEKAIQEEIEFFAYQILDTETHKYSSTHVSSFNYSVSSNVAFHSDQQIWGINLATQKEEMLEFLEANVPVRPGHIVVFAKNKNLDRFESAKNITTGNSWRLDNKGSTHSRLKKSDSVIIASVLGWLAAIPYIGSFVQSVCVFIILRTKKGCLHDAEGVHKKFFALLLLIINPVYLAILWHWPTNYRGKFTDFWILYVIGALVISAVQVAAVLDERKQMTIRAKYLEKSMDDYGCALNLEPV
jgi:hypothetical protein